MAPLNPLDDSSKKKIIFQGIAKEDNLIANKSAEQVIQSNRESAFRAPVLPTLENSGGLQATIFNFSAQNVGIPIQNPDNYHQVELVQAYNPIKAPTEQCLAV